MSDSRNMPEPSMEEILSSIRRIIADEQDEGERPREALTATGAERGSEEDVLELTEEAPGRDDRSAATAAAGESQPSVSGAPEGARDGKLHEASKDGMAMDASTQDNALVSASAASASTSALSKLTKAAGSGDKPATPGSGKTIEELVVELMRPALKEWLDTNLAPIVERVVEQEVKKLARRAELL